MILAFDKKENVPLESIDLNNNSYKISSPCAGEKKERLKKSIVAIGILEPPVLLKKNNSYTIIFGHNRFSILKEIDTASVLSFVLKDIDPEKYIEYIQLKNYRGEISSTGKIKFINILKNLLKFNQNQILQAARNIQYPGEFMSENIFTAFFSLPEPLKDYLDYRDIGFKTIKNILLLPNDALQYLSLWTQDMNMRVNIFKGILDLIIDIYKRDKNVSLPGRIEDISEHNDRRKNEEILYKELYKIRYPEYSALKLKALEIIDQLEKKDMKIDFPEFFEKNEIDLIFKLKKRNDIRLLEKKFKQIDFNKLKDLMDLL